MADTIAGAIIENLTASQDVLNGLATYDGRPAIFHQYPVPTAAVRPYVILNMPLSDSIAVGENSKQKRGDHFHYQLDIVTNQRGVYSKAESIARAAIKALHRQPMAVTGYVVERVNATGPHKSPSDHYVTSAIVNIVIKIREA